MKTKRAAVNKNSESEIPLENQPAEWLQEDIAIEDRKPDLGEIEDDTAEIDNAQ